MVQRLPAEEAAESVDADGWNRVRVLMDSVTDAELLDPDLAHGDLLYHLFHEDGVRVFETAPLHAACRCSRGRVVDVLRALDRGDRDDLKADDGSVVVTCEFCGRAYRFADADLDALEG